MAILGPRQCGKTTFSKMEFPDYEYFDLEKPSHFDQIFNDIELFLKNRKRNFVIDEAQRLPKLISALRSFVGDQETDFKVILLGSSSLKLNQKISESLAGRVGYLDLHKFFIEEIHPFNVAQHWLKGGFPDAISNSKQDKLNFDWFENYTRSLIERDWPAIGIQLNSIQFRRFWTLLSLSNGDLLNKNKIASSMGISPHTVERYIEILEESYLIQRLPPYFTNLKKRLVKSPKVYLRDSGLLHYFLKIMNFDDLYVSPERGNSFEGYVIEQLGKMARLYTPEYDRSFFRSSDSFEIDFLLHKGQKLIPIEIKSKTSISKGDIKGLIKSMELLNIKKGFVIYNGDDSFQLTEKIDAISLSDWATSSDKIFWTR